MKLTFQIVITDESGSRRAEKLMILQRPGDALNDIGLSVSESKQLLGSVHQSVVHQQADEWPKSSRCSGVKRRTLFVTDQDHSPE